MKRYLYLSLLVFLLYPVFPAASGPVLHLAVGEFDPMVAPLAVPDELRSTPGPGEKAYYLVQFNRLPSAKTLQQIGAFGQVLDYFPDLAYVVSATTEQVSSIQAHPAVRWVGLYQPYYKLSPAIGTYKARQSQTQYSLTVELFRAGAVQAVSQQVEGLGGTVISAEIHGDTNRMNITLPVSRLNQLAALPEVRWVEEVPDRTPRDSTASWVVQSDVSTQYTEWSHGLHGEGQIVGVIDFELPDKNSCYFSQSGKFVAIHNASGSTNANTHATFVVGEIAGNQSPYTSAESADGLAYQAKISFTNQFDIGGNLSTYQALTNEHGDGAHVHSNSWGNDNDASYTQDCSDIDKFSRDNDNDVVIFAETNLSSLKSPENAKDVIGVGASQNAPDEENWCVGGAGPTGDGRIKPDLLIPGCNIVAATVGSCATRTDQATSYAAPIASATAAIIRQYYTEGWYPTGSKNSGNGFNPTGALLKATLLNSSADMTGVSGWPDMTEGWGRPLLDNSLYFSGNTQGLQVHDVSKNQGFPTGDTSTDSYNLSIQSGGPLKVTLVWTDPSSPAGSSGAIINKLNLKVVTPDGTFKGNVFSGGQSVTGGNYDNTNNVQMVYLKTPTAGNITVSVIANTIAQGPQGYALVVSYGLQSGSTTFSDNFNNGASDISNWTFKGQGTASVVSGELVLQTSRKYTATPPYSGCNDCQITLDVDPTSATFFSIVFEYRDSGDYREVRALPGSNAFLLIDKQNGNVVRKDKANFNFQNGQMAHVVVNDSGSSVSLSVNGSQIYNQGWSNVGSGKVMFKCKNGTCTMDNLDIQ